jgi:hypothetical protein
MSCFVNLLGLGAPKSNDAKPKLVIMKRIMVLVGLMLSVAIGSAEAQTINDIPIKDIDSQYVAIIGLARVSRSKVRIQINFGRQIPLLPSRKENIIRDAEGKLVEFEAMVEALNFMAEIGYELVSTNVANFNDGSQFHYVLKKKDD